MNCQDFQEQLFEYLDGTLSAATREGLDRHLRTCDDCRTALGEQRRLARELTGQFRQSTQALTLNPEVRQRILGALPAPSARPDESPSARRSSPSVLEALAGLVRSSPWRWAVAACLLVVGVAMGARWLGLRSPSRTAPQFAEGTVTVSTRIPQVVTTYTFRREGQFVTDALITRAEIVQEMFLANLDSKPPEKN